MEITVSLTREEIDKIVYDYLCRTVCAYAEKKKKMIKAVNPKIDQRDLSLTGYDITLKLNDDDFRGFGWED